MDAIANLVGALDLEIVTAKVACLAATDAAAAASKRVDALDALVKRLVAASPKSSIAAQIQRLEDEKVILAAERNDADIAYSRYCSNFLSRPSRELEDAKLAQAKRRVAGVMDDQLDLIVKNMQTAYEPIEKESKRMRDVIIQIDNELNSIAKKIYNLRAAATAPADKVDERAATNARLASGVTPAFAPPPYKP